MGVFLREASIGLIRSGGLDKRLLWVVGESQFVPPPENDHRAVPMIVFQYDIHDGGKVTHYLPIFDGRSAPKIHIPDHCEDVLSPDILTQRPELYGRLPRKS